MKDLHNKVAVITGASSGIGRALAVQLAQHGTRLALSDLRAEGLAETAGLISTQGSEVRTYPVDVSDRQGMLQLAEDVLADFGQADILVNNAGVTLSPKPFDQISPEEFEWLLSINLWGVYNGVHAFLPHLRSRPQGSIVNLCSTAGLAGLMGYSPYAMSKMGMRGLSEALQMELARTNVTVTLVYPGGVKTNIINHAPDFDSEEARQTMNRFFQMGALLTPEKVAARIVRAIRRRQPRVILGPDAKLINFMHSLLPRSFPRALHPLFSRMMVPPTEET